MTDRSGRDHSELFYWLALAMTPGVGSRRCARLLEIFHTPRAVFQARPGELMRYGLPGETVEALTRFDWGGRVEDELKKIEEKGYHLLTWDDDRYPARLKQIPDPPPVLWLSGELRPEDALAVAMVGARAATESGRQTANRLAGELAAAGVTVVSGLALGIDAAAHRGTLGAGGRTIGVLGCGLDVIYPRDNSDLLARIPASGALLSELPLATPPQAPNFPRRNRIISGLSLAVVVVEAGERSGALITARMALEQNREVMAVPGRAGSPKSLGAHSLLRQGAILVESAQDILLEIMPQVLPREPRPKGSTPQVEARRTKVHSPGGHAPGLLPLSLDEQEVCQALLEGPLHVDVLGRVLGWPAPRITATLVDMEIRGLVKQMPGQRYGRVD